MNKNNNNNHTDWTLSHFARKANALKFIEENNLKSARLEYVCDYDLCGYTVWYRKDELKNK